MEDEAEVVWEVVADILDKGDGLVCGLVVG
jgi:hypothetical protein